MLLKCSDKFADLRFAIQKTDSTIQIEDTENEIQLIIGNKQISELPVIYEKLSKHFNLKRDIRKVRDGEIVQVDNTFLSYLSLYIHYKDLISKCNLKNSKYFIEMVERYNMSHIMFYCLQISVGKIIDIKEIDGSDKLFIETVMFTEPTQIVSGIRQLYKKEDLINKKCLFITNIKKRKIKGETSNGMILCAHKNDNTEVLFVDEFIPEGQIVSTEYKNILRNVTTGIIDIKKKFFSDIFAKLSICDNFLVYDGIKLKLGNSYIKSSISCGSVG